MATPYFLSMIDPATIVMGAFFLIFLAMLSYILSKVFRDKYGNVSTGIVGVISFCISVLIIYFGRDIIYNILDGLQLSNIIIYVLSGVAVLVLLYLFRKKLRGCMLLMLVGAGLILISILTDWFYQKWFVILVGVILFLLGLWLCSKKKQISGGPRFPNPPNGAGPGHSPGPKKGNLLIKEARAFKKKALRSKNPRFNGGWTHFVSYLKEKRRYGSNEATIASYFGVSKGEFVNIFNRYGLVK